MKYWIVKISEDLFKIVVKYWTIGFKKLYNELQQINNGDKIVIYIKRRGVIGFFEVTSKLFEEKVFLFKDDLRPHRLRVRPIVILSAPFRIKITKHMDIWRKKELIPINENLYNKLYKESLKYI